VLLRKSFQLWEFEESLVAPSASKRAVGDEEDPGPLAVLHQARNDGGGFE